MLKAVAALATPIFFALLLTPSHATVAFGGTAQNHRSDVIGGLDFSLGIPVQLDLFFGGQSGIVQDSTPFIHGGDIPIVPEPETWGLMFVGLIAVGLKLRSRFWN